MVRMAKLILVVALLLVASLAAPVNLTPEEALAQKKLPPPRLPRIEELIEDDFPPPDPNQGPVKIRRVLPFQHPQPDPQTEHEDPGNLVARPFTQEDSNKAKKLEFYNAAKGGVTLEISRNNLNERPEGIPGIPDPSDDTIIKVWPGAPEREAPPKRDHKGSRLSPSPIDVPRPEKVRPLTHADAIEERRRLYAEKNRKDGSKSPPALGGSQKS